MSEIDRSAGRSSGVRDAGGFSLLEVVIASTILFTIILMAGGFIMSSNAMLGAMSSRAEADVKAGQIADRIALLLRNAHSQSVMYYPNAGAMPDGGGYPYIYFRLIKEFRGRAYLGDGYYIHAYVAAGENLGNGIDDDKDGRVDEVCYKMENYPAANYTTDDPSVAGAFGSVTADYSKLAMISENLRWPNTLPSGGSNPPYGFYFTRTGNTIRIQVTTVRYDPTTRQTIYSTAETSVKLRT